MKKHLLFLTLFALMLSTAWAGNYKVTSNAGDASAGYLRQAISNVNSGAGGDTITFDPSLNGQIITLTSYLGTLKKSVNITGNVDANGKPAITIDGIHRTLQTWV